jgi:phosphate transport system protein
MRSRFDEQLHSLNGQLITMGTMCEEAILIASKALINDDRKLAGDVAPIAQEIDHMERDIESLCMKMLLQQQPVAGDLRQISAALKMVTDMERIGDQAEDIAEIIKSFNGRLAEEHNLISEMAQSTIKMVTDSLNAYVKKDIELAETVIAYDDVVDNCFSEMKMNLIGVIAENPKDGEYAIDLLMIAKYFERIGDHAVNIAEWVLFSITGNKLN